MIILKIELKNYKKGLYKWMNKYVKVYHDIKDKIKTDSSFAQKVNALIKEIKEYKNWFYMLFQNKIFWDSTLKLILK